MKNPNLKSIHYVDPVRHIPFHDGTRWQIVNPARYEGILVIGNRGSGKSSLLERIAIALYNKDRMVFDALHAWGSYESFYYPFDRDDPTEFSGIKTLIITPEDTELEYPPQYDVATRPDTDSFESIVHQATTEHRVLVWGYSLYTAQEIPDAQQKLVDWIYQLPEIRASFKTDWVLLVREAAGFAYSRFKGLHGNTQLKAALTTLGREARSSLRFSFVFDTQKQNDVDVQLRREFDKIVVKTQYADDLSADLAWLPKAITDRQERYRGQRSYTVFPDLPFLKQSEGYLVIRGRRHFQKFSIDMPPFRHRQEMDELQDFGVTVKRKAAFSEFRWGKIKDVTKMKAEQKEKLIRDVKALPSTVKDRDIAEKLGVTHVTVWNWRTDYGKNPKKE